MLPVPGVVTGVIKSNVKIEALADKIEDFLLKAGKDKILQSKYKKSGSLTLSSEKEWEDGKTGTYAITIGFE